MRPKLGKIRAKIQEIKLVIEDIHLDEFNSQKEELLKQRAENAKLISNLNGEIASLDEELWKLNISNTQNSDNKLERNEKKSSEIKFKRKKKIR